MTTRDKSNKSYWDDPLPKHINDKLGCLFSELPLVESISSQYDYGACAS